MGWEKATEIDESLHKGLNIVKGEADYKEITDAFGWEVGLA